MLGQFVYKAQVKFLGGSLKTAFSISLFCGHSLKTIMMYRERKIMRVVDINKETLRPHHDRYLRLL